MSATAPTVTAKIPGLTGGDYTLDVKSSRIALDENRVPYGEADLVVALPPLSVLAQITPYAALRVQVTVTQSWLMPVRAAQTRTFDFLLHERKINHLEATLAIRAVTDEAMLLDRLNTSTALARSYGLSVKDACAFALAFIGATLEAGWVDATLTGMPRTTTNLIADPSIENGGGGYGEANLTLDRNDTSWALQGTRSLNLYNPTNADSYAAVEGVSGAVNNAVVGGKTYVLSATGNVKSALSGGTIAGSPERERALVIFYQVAGGAFVSLASAQVPNVVNTPTRVSVEVTVPVGVSNFFIRAYLGRTAGQIRWDGFRLSEKDTTVGADNTGFFDGNTPAATNVVYAWTGATNNSRSTRVDTFNTDATIWRPGQSLDEWLAPLLQAANRRLFCDEKRKWRLVDANYAVDGVVTISEGFNAKTGSDTMSRQKTEGGVSVWFDHVAVHYKWTDAAGVVQEKWDFAGTGTVKGVLVELTTPWPGPGAATAILARANGRGRTQDVTALTDYAPTPGMAIVTTLPGTPVQSGVTSSVEWIWDDDLDEMALTSRGLIDTPLDAWLFVVGDWTAATGTWASGT